MIDTTYRPTRKTWEEFQKFKLLWFVNRSLCIFGWAIVFEQTSTGLEVYPARVKYRGFPEEAEIEGFEKLTSYLASVIDELKQEVL